MSKIRLGVNIDHVGTVRNARGENYPSPLKAALLAEKSGADSITIHLREDRRHIIDSDLNKIKSCVKLTGYVNSTEEFKDQPKIINGASDIIAKVFEQKGEHTRAAISANSLPLGVAVEVDAIFEII